MAKPSEAGTEALRRLKATDPPSWLAPNPELSETARAASQYLFSTLRPFSQKSPLDHLLVNGFDAEQIWQQIDLQSQPLLSSLRRRLKHLAKNPEEINHLKVASEGVKKTEEKKKKKLDESDEESDGFDEELDEDDEDEELDEDVEKENGKEEEDEEEEEEGGDSEEENGEDGGVEDKFLKIGELNKYLEKEEENFENGKVDEKGDDDDDEDTEDDEESDEVRVLCHICCVYESPPFNSVWNLNIDEFKCLFFCFIWLLTNWFLTQSFLLII